jgi:outer membrane protein TolC
MRACLLAVMLAAARAAAAPEPAAPGVSTSALKAGDYVSLALAASPSVNSAAESLRAAEDAFNGQVAEMTLPTLTFSASKYPYGDDPNLGYAFHGLSLNASNSTSNTVLNWNVFNGFQDWTSMRSKQEARESARHAYDQARQTASFAALQAFYALSGAARLREVARDDLRAQVDQYHETQGLYKDGLKSLADLFKSETEWHESQIRLVGAEAAYKAALQPFNELINHPPWEEHALDAALEAGATELPSLEEDAALLPQRRPEILAALRGEKAAEYNERLSLLQALPTLSINATWTRSDTTIDGLSSASFGIPNPNRQIGATLSITNFNVFSQLYSYAAARATRRQAQDAVDAAVRAAREDLYSSWISLESAAKVYVLAVREADIAEQGLEIVEAQYRQGSADALRMAQARTDLLTARQQVETNIQNINLYRAQYRRAAGITLW